MTFRPANFDPSIDPTADQVRALRDAGPDGPVVMLNLLKFRQQANYPAGSPHPPCSDIEALQQQPWHLLVLDEAQMVKNAASRAAGAPRRRNARHRLCVTGTPLENHLGEPMDS